MLEREQRGSWLPREPRGPLGAHSSERAAGFATASHVRGLDPLSAPGVGPRRPALPPSCQAAWSPGPGGRGRGGETEQVAIRSASEHSWTAPAVDINNRLTGSEKSRGGGQGGEEEGFIKGRGSGIVAICKDLLTKGVEGRRDLRMNRGTKSGNKNTEGEELVPFCPTSTTCLPSPQNGPSDWQGGLCKERARLWSPDPARLQILCKLLKVTEPQFLHLYNGSPNAYKEMIVSLVEVKKGVLSKKSKAG